MPSPTNFRADAGRAPSRPLNRAALRAVELLLYGGLVLAAVRLAIVHCRGESDDDRDQLGRVVRDIDGPRGLLVDHEGLPLARSVLAYDVDVECWSNGDLGGSLATLLGQALAADRVLSPDEQERIASHLRLPEPALRRDLWSGGSESTEQGPFRWYWRRSLARGVQAEESLRSLRELGRQKLPGCRFRVLLREVWKRVYPLGTSAAHVVGMVALDQDGDPVATGLEALPALLPDDGVRIPLRLDARGAAYSDGHERLSLASEARAARITTTLRADCQVFAHERLESAVAEQGARWGMCLLADLENGDLYCLAGSPSYDPEQRIGGQSYWPMTHQALVQPGSVIKPLVVGLALERGLVRPGEVIACQGEAGSRSWAISSQRNIVDDHFVGVVPLEQLMIQSSNIGAVRVGRRGGAAFHREMLDLFGLARAPQLGLPLPLVGKPGRRTEQRGVVPGPQRFRKASDYDVYTGPSLSFGYQLQVYPITFAEAFAACVTGREARFRLVAAVQEPGEPTVVLPPFAGRRVLSEATVRWMRQTLARVVTDPLGTAHRHISGPGVDGVIGGKTGTSFVARGEGREATASFVGFAPVDSPRWLAMAVLQKDNVKGYYGGQFAAPIVKDLLLHVLRRDELRRRAAADRTALVATR